MDTMETSILPKEGLKNPKIESRMHRRGRWCMNVQKAAGVIGEEQSCSPLMAKRLRILVP